MSYLTYDKSFQMAVINDKKNMTVKELSTKYDISVYTIYKILHMNNEMPIPNQAVEDISSTEGVEHRSLSSNNNNSHERPESTWKYHSDRHKKIKHTCKLCGMQFMSRDRGSRTKFCSTKCKCTYRTLMNSAMIACYNCGNEFRVKNSNAKSYVNCPACRKKGIYKHNTSINAINMIKWLMSENFKVEVEKTFDWLYDPDKPKGRFKLDAYLPEHNICVEYDGEQHFKPCFTSKWESVDKVQYRDRLKEKLCSKHGIKTIRFRYDAPFTKDIVLAKIYAEL